MKFSLLCSMVLIVLIGHSASADIFAPSHGCTKPIKPYQFQTEWEVDDFLSAVDRYERFISDFVDQDPMPTVISNEIGGSHDRGANRPRGGAGLV